MKMKKINKKVVFVGWLIIIFSGWKYDDRNSLNIQIDACSILTKEDVEEVFGEKMKEGRNEIQAEGEEENAALSQCTYYSQKSSRSVSLMIRTENDNSEFAIQKVRQTLELSRKEVTDLPDIGFTSFWAEPQLHIFKGVDQYLIISVQGFSSNDSLEKAKAIAKIIIGRI